MRKKINGKELLEKLTDLGWDYQCLTRSGRETYDEIMTMLGVLKEGEQWYEVQPLKCNPIVIRKQIYENDQS